MPSPCSCTRSGTNVGIVANGERVNRIYVERNVAATEAQFGISDWDPDGDGWASYARTDGASAFGTIVDVIATDLNGDHVPEPVVRIQHPSKGCRTLRPNRTSPTTHGESRRMVIAQTVSGTCQG